MSAPEPLRLTLEEALGKARDREWRVVFYDDGDVCILDRRENELAFRPGWANAFGRALGRPVAERDDRAELIEALDLLVGTIGAHDITCASCDRDGRDDCDCLEVNVQRARAALAKARGEA